MDPVDKYLIITGLIFLIIGFILLIIDFNSFITGFATQNIFYFAGFICLLFASLFMIWIGEFFITETLEEIRRRKQLF